MDWMQTLKQLAPTVASAFLGPMGGVAVAAVGNLLGVSDATQDKIAQAIQAGQLTPEQLGQLKELELRFQAEERERGFRYSELAFKDRDSARKANVEGGTSRLLFAMSVVLLIITLGSEVYVLFNGVPEGSPEIIIGRVLGLMDSVALMVLAYHYGSSSGSAIKSQMLAAK